MTDVVLFGAQGQLGHLLAPRLERIGRVRAVDHAELDLANGAQLRDYLRDHRPRLIVNAAAYTAVDQAEREADAAFRVNAEAPDVMAQAAAATGALLVHYSTDYVFDGEATRPYPESAPTQPLGVYGTSKLAGEQRVRASGARALILRTAWLYSNHGKNFLKTVLRLAAERPELRIVNDQTGSPTYAGTVAELTLQMLDQVIDDKAGSPRFGICHLVCEGQTTWYEFAREILRLTGSACPIHPITTADYPTPARRPRYSVLATARLREVFGIQPPSWPMALQQCLRDGGLLERG